MNHLAEEIFTQALELDPGDRQHFVDEACAGDRELRHLVEQLLVDAEGADAYFTKALGEAPWVGPSGHRLIEKEGDWVGPYKLLQQIGEGGFGVVWMAEQSKPISRRVAVKVIKAGMDTKEVLARFDAERQALARMDHRNIARVIDAGVTLTGRPYFAMDLVKGMPITRYCDEQQLDANERLLLFADVCAAINHAHQKGVIHRDIKPSNVLVTLDGDKPMVKVIDFGISKAIEGKLTDGTLFTRLEQWVGTPVYMSPEQAGLGSLDIDTRSDIYALGVLLYELLTGVPPFDQDTLIKAGYEEMRRIIREVEPVRPSQRLTSLHAEQAAPIAAARRVSGDRLHRLIAADLDWIVMKAIDKSRDRRYDTAAALSDDIERFLADEPVTAKPPSPFYLFRKFAKRHRAGFLAACGFAVVLVATAAFSTWQALRATKAEALAGKRLTEAVAATNSLTKAEALAQQRLTEAVTERNAKDRALQDAQAANNLVTKSEALAQQRLADAIAERNAKKAALQDAQAVSKLLTEVFKRPNPEIDGRKVTVVEALDAATEELNVELSAQPERLTMLLEVLAGTYERLALDDKSLPLRARALEIRRSHPGIEHPESLDSLHQLIENHERLGQYASSRDLAKEEVALSRRIRGDDHEQTLAALRSLANGYFLTGDRAKATAAQQELLDGTRTVYGELSRPFAIAQWQLKKYQQPDAGSRKDGPSDRTPGTPVPGKTGGALRANPKIEVTPAKNGNLRKAEEEFTANRKTYGLTHLKTLDAQSRLAEIQYNLKLTDDAIRNQTEILVLAQKEYGPLNETTLRFHCRLASMCYNANQPNEAIRLQRKLLSLLRERDGDAASSTINCEDDLLYFLFRAGQWSDHLDVLNQAFERRCKSLGQESPSTLSLESDLVLRLFGTGDINKALVHAEHSVPLLRKTCGNEDRRTLNAISNLARCYTAVGKGREAITLLKECCPKMRDDTYVNFLLAQLQLWYGLIGDYNVTRKWMMDYAVSRRASFNSRHDILERVVYIACLAPPENEAQAVEIGKTLEIAQTIRLAPGANMDLGHAGDLRNLIAGMALVRTGQPAKAIPHFDEAMKLINAVLEGSHLWDKSTVSYYKAIALHQSGREDEGRALFDETEKHMVRWTSDEQPLEHQWAPSGERLTQWLAYKEAKTLIEPAIPAVEK
jgi:serine/threonine protein kinase